MIKSRTRLTFPTAFLLSVLLLASSPAPQTAEESSCGPHSGNLCWSNESCLNVFFFKMCTTNYKYYPKEAAPPEEAAPAEETAPAKE